MSIDLQSPSNTIETIKADVAAMGANFNPSVLISTRDIYRSHIPVAGFEGIQCIADVVWGDHERHTVDVYRPVKTSLAPVLLFVHGGGFIAGSKREDETFHRNVGEYFARHGFLTLITNYRLAPENPWPDGAQDIGRVLAWAQNHVGEWGGQTNCIQVLGQSAGSSHVASWIFDEQVRGSSNNILRGAALMSGVYRLMEPLPPPLQSYWGSDPMLYAQRAPISHVKPSKLPLLLTVTEFDPAWLARHTFDLALELTIANGQSPRFAWFEGHNHVSTGQSLGSPQDDVGQKLLAFFRANI
jgi:acetyl esterase/lipase